MQRSIDEDYNITRRVNEKNKKVDVINREYEPPSEKLLRLSLIDKSMIDNFMKAEKSLNETAKKNYLSYLQQLYVYEDAEYSTYVDRDEVEKTIVCDVPVLYIAAPSAIIAKLTERGHLYAAFLDGLHENYPSYNVTIWGFEMYVNKKPGVSSLYKDDLKFIISEFTKT